MDRIVTATEANQRFSELLRDVSQGDSFTITSRGKPVARVTAPVPEQSQADKIDAYIERTKNRPIVYTGPWKREDLYK